MAGINSTPMTQTLINRYLAQLDVLKKASGTNRESVVYKAFKNLLKGLSKQHDQVFIPEYELGQLAIYGVSNAVLAPGYRSLNQQRLEVESD